MDTNNFNQDQYSTYSFHSLSDPSANKIFKTVIKVVGCTGTILSFLVLLVICLKSPAAMTKFKRYLMFYQLCNLSVELIAVLCEPVLIPKILIFFFLGPLERVPIYIFKSLMVTIIFSCFAVLYLFVGMLFERYFVMSMSLPSWVPFYKNIKFYLSAFSVVLILVNIAFLFFFFSAFQSGEAADIVVKNSIIDSQLFFDKQLPYVIFDKSYFKPIAITMGMLIPGFSLLMTTVIFLTLWSYMKHAKDFSRATRNSHKMVIKMLLFQVPTMVVFVACPLAVMSYNIIADNNGNFFTICICMIWTFPLIDSLVIIIVIRPYRRFVRKIVCRKEDVSNAINSINNYPVKQ